MRAIEAAAILPESGTESDYDPGCRRCRRLAAFVDRVRRDHPDYWCRPVAPFGRPDARLLVVGLAPGMHGANASGRAFTGDHAGILLYETLFDFGYATAKAATARDDGLELLDCRISNAVKCLPPDNRPLPAEVRECSRYLAVDLARLREGAAVVALGRVAHEAVLRVLRTPLRAHPFAHGARHALDAGRIAMFDSFHCSRYNTNTGRLTRAMFRDVFRAASLHLGRTPPRA
ncbi:MAG: uracil-DNA glycosylase [Burkholderiales bacterium]|nr:uracil-DNA glycosylase [Burkholderiales bacterium]MCE7875894.1 uracil-DNA glycosylase [Betaproteobacteria bacterium PRO3]